MANQKTANDYRKERKERLAKAAKKNSRKSVKLNGPSISRKATVTIWSIIGIVAVIVIAGLFCSELGVFERLKTIKTEDGHTYSAAEYEYYYRSAHNYYYNNSYNYDNQYGEGYGAAYTGYDYKKQPEEQTCSIADFTNEDGSQPNWKQYLEHLALQSLARYHSIEDLAKENGFKVSDKALKEAEDQLQQLKDSIAENAAQNNGQVVSLGKYLRNAFGKGLSESLFKQIIRRETISNEYSKKLIEDKMDSYTDEEYQKEYDKDPTAYQVVDLKLFSISPESPKLAEDASEEEKTAATEKADKEAKDKAEKLLKELKDVDSFNKTAEKYATDDQKKNIKFDDDTSTLMSHALKSSLSQFSEDDINWIFSADRKTGDKKSFEVSGSYYIVMMVKAAYRDDETKPVDVRHILYKFADEEKPAEGEEVDEAQKEAAAEADKAQKKADAEATLEKIRKAADVEKTFIEICQTDSEDTGSKEDGGLISRLGKGKYVKNFENWALDPARKEGDIDVIETEYGYHVMYFVKHYDRPEWQLTIGETLANESITKQLDEKADSERYKVDPDNAAVKKLAKNVYKEILTRFYPDAQPVTTTAAPETAAPAQTEAPAADVPEETPEGTSAKE